MNVISQLKKLYVKIKHTFKTSNHKQKKDEPIFEGRTKQPNFFLSIFMTTLKMFFVLGIIICVAGAGAVIGIAKAYVETTPTLDVGKIEDQAQTSFIYDANGKLITEYSGIENRVWATLPEIPKNLQNAFIAIEDVRFRSHQGVDIKRLLGAFINNMKNEDVQGGSTITQQLIKNRILSSEVTYKRKIQEAYLAIQLEKQYTKDQILEAYLNTIHLGGSNYGVKAAAKDYYGKELKDLTLRECAMLAGITKNPYGYNPRINMYERNDMQTTNNRTNLVLYAMYENGFVLSDAYDKAKSENVAILKDSQHQKLYEMAYFVEYAIYDVVTHLLKQQNLQDNLQDRNTIKKQLMTKGYHIYTTVDPIIQKTVEDSLANWKKYPRLISSKYNIMQVKNKDGSVSEIQQPQASAVVFDYHSGELKAIVGGRFSPEKKEELNRAYQATMPVGSSIKPIAVYGPAIDKGASPATIEYNIPAKIKGWDTPKGYPDNYGGGGFTGPTSLRVGLVKSLNVIAARTLMDYVTVDDSVNYLISLGINPAHINKGGAGLALGTSGITPIEMSVAFGAIGNRGIYQEPISFTKVVSSTGEIILDAKALQVKRQVFKPSTAWLLVDMMHDAVTSGTGTGAQIKNMTVVGKTGTNSDQKGVFFTGITPYYSAAVWIGHDGYKPLAGDAQGGRFAAPLFQDFMSKIHNGLQDKPIIADTPESLGLIKATVCGVSGQRLTALCANDLSGHGPVTDWFLKGTVPTKNCEVHQQITICTASNKLAGPYCPEELKKTVGVIVIPEKSSILNLSSDQLQKYFPGAISSLSNTTDLATLDINNPNNARFICNIHTKIWQDQNQLRQQDILNAQQSIVGIRQKMTNNVSLIPQNQVDQLNALILKLEQLFPQGDSISIQNATNELNQQAKVWQDQNQLRQQDILNAQQSIVGIRQKMTNNVSLIPQNQVDQLNALILKLEQLFPQGDSISIQNATNELNQQANIILIGM